MITAFNCILICPIGFVKLRFNCKNAAIPPRVKPAILFIAKIEPTTATSTYEIYPIFITIGIKTFANVFAFALASNNASFTRSKSLMLCSSCVKTLMTLLPSIISSIKPFSTPNCFCWAIKYLPDFAEIFFEV